MNLGQLLGGAGVVGSSMRAEEDAQRLSRQRQLQTNELNRLERLRAAQDANDAQGRVSQITPRNPMSPGMTQGQPFGTPPVSAAPVAPAPAAAPAVAAAPTTGGVRRMPPADVARLKQDPYATGQVALTPDEIRQGFNRTALLRAPALVADIVQSPVAGGLNLGSAAIYGAQNLIGRGMNYMFGTNMPTAVQPPQFPLLPFFSRVKQMEDELASGTRTLPPRPEAPAVRRMSPADVARLQQDPYAMGAPAAPTPAPAAPAAPTKPNQYDKPTPYDALIQQSAQQYGIDPVMFKRLIGTESSFNPQAVSPRGERFGLGIAQIADIHPLTREQRLDPNIAIPFAAQLFSQYLQQSGGNAQEALMRYKGATSEKGRTAMQKPINEILGGTTSAAPTPIAAPGTAPSKVADAVAAATKPAAPVSGGTMYGPAAVDASANNPIIQQALNERQDLVNQIALMEKYGFGDRARALVPQIKAIDLGLYKAQADQGIYEGASTGNFSRAMEMLSYFRGIPHQVLDRGDRTFDLYVNGKVSKTAMTVEALSDLIRSNVDADYRERKAALVGKRAEQAMKIEEIMVEQVLKARGNAEVATIQAMGQIADEFEKRKGVKATHNTNNNTILVQETDNAGNTRVFVIDPTGTKTEMRGETITSPLRTQIYGSK